MTFGEILDLAQEGLARWKDKPHNARWWRKIDGTPIPNDLLVNIAEVIADRLRATPPGSPLEREALANRLGKVAGRTSLERDREIIIEACNALLALTPVVAREPVGWQTRVMRDKGSKWEHEWCEWRDCKKEWFDYTNRQIAEGKAARVETRSLYTSPPPASAVREAFPPSPDVEYVASRGQSKVSYWVTREEGDDIRARALSIKGTDLKQADETSKQKLTDPSC